MPNSKFIPHVLSILTGFAVCLAVSVLTGRKEAWDSEWYFMAGIPLMCFVMMMISYRWPQDSWRWAFGMAMGQSIAMALSGNSLSLWPLSIMAMTVCSVPQFVTGFVTNKAMAYFKTKKRE